MQRTRSYSSSSLVSLPSISYNAFTHAPARIDDVPSPDPRGMLITCVERYKPLPRFPVISSTETKSLYGITPHAIRAALCNANGSYGLLESCNSVISVKRCSAPLSALASTMTGSSIFRTTISIGQFPSSITAAFNTVPPYSIQYGGVSLHPPPQFTRTGRRVITSSFCIFASESYVSPFTALERIALLIVLKQESLYVSSKQDKK